MNFLRWSFLYFIILSQVVLAVPWNDTLSVGDSSLGTNLIFDINSTTKASRFCPPMTTTQRNAITPANGGCVYDTDLDEYQTYNGAAWGAMSGVEQTALEALSTTGVLTRTGAATYSTRTLTGTTDEIVVTNGDGVSGNPTFGIADNPVLTGTGGVEVPSGTTAQQAGNNGTIRYNTDTSSFEGKKGGTWSGIGGGGSPNFDQVFDLFTADEKSTSDFSTGNNATIMGGGTLVGTLSESSTSADLMDANDNSVFVYTAGASDETNDYYCTEALTIPQGLQNSGGSRQDILHKFWYWSEIDESVLVKAYCVDDAVETEHLSSTPALKNVDLLYGDNDGTKDLDEGVEFNVGNGVVFSYPTTCKSTRLCIHVQEDLTSGEKIIFNKITTGVMPVNRVETIVNTGWVDFSPTIAGMSNATFTYSKWRRVGDSIEINMTGDSGTGITATEFQLNLPNGLEVSSDYNLTDVGSAQRDALTAAQFVVLATSGDTFLNMGYRDTGTANGFTAVNSSTMIGASEDFSIRATVQIEGWSAGNKAIAITGSNPNTGLKSYTPTFTGFGSVTVHDFFWARNDDRMLIYAQFTGASSTATEGQITLPSVCGSNGTTQCTVKSGLTVRSIGTFTVGGASTDSGGTVLITGGDSYFNFSRADCLNGNSTDCLVPQNGNAIIGASVMTFAVEVPIEGWSASPHLNYMLSTINVGGAESFNVTFQDNFWDSASGTSEWNHSLASPAFSTSQHITVSDDDSKTKIFANKNVKIIVAASSQSDDGGGLELYNSSDVILQSDFSSKAGGYRASVVIPTILKAGDYIYLKDPDPTTNRKGSISILVEPYYGPTSYAHIISQPELIVDTDATNAYVFMTGSTTYQSASFIGTQYDDGTGITVDATNNELDIPAGTYSFEIPVGAYNGCDYPQLQIYDETNSAQLFESDRVTYGNGTGAVSFNTVFYAHTFGADTTISFDVKCSASFGNSYLGDFKVTKKR